MAFNIGDFNSVINKNGLAKSNLFFVSITFPPGLIGDGQMGAREMSYFCQNIQLPSLEVSASPIKTRGYGPAEKRPTDMEFSPMNATFMVDSGFKVMNTFHKWFQSVVHYDGTGGATTFGGKKLYEFGYKSDYAGKMTVYVFSQNTNKLRYVYNFDGLWPLSVGEIQPAWENSAEILTLPVTFTYSEMSVSGSQQGAVLADVVKAEKNRIEQYETFTQEDIERAVEEDVKLSEEEKAKSQENQKAERSKASISGFTRSAVADTPEYQKALDDARASYKAPSYWIDGKVGGTLQPRFEKYVPRKADLAYKAGLADGSIIPPEDSGIVVTKPDPDGT